VIRSVKLPRTTESIQIAIRLASNSHNTLINVWGPVK